LDDAVSYTDFLDAGLGNVSGDTADYGKFKTPSLRNIELTAPYMHDGRFATLEEVLDFYSEGVHDTPFTDNLIQFAYQGGVQLTAEEKAAIIAFLKTLTDPDFENNPAYQDPFSE
jgi:cytochrome c peroxidase